ncbi:uncharacterized protein LOC114256179 [Camellia sinensis]|uniref:uncharacterized protein LOC114256179 n=1 Tax=Camellia sinensis TaxID=4442 RepID=UPI0010362BF4|nr:uncharacterized protein LOC114256179 [Camellia sinensis]
MDGFSGYNQIKMAEEDAEKTVFRTSLKNFFYTVMPFGLKNAGATYQRTMTAIFYDMIHYEVEDYVDDLVVKSKKEEDHLRDLDKVFKRCQKFKMRMNPLKCAFGVMIGKFLGFLVHRYGIEADEDKNNEAEYEALILGLIAVEKHSIKKIRIWGDSKLIVKQVSRQFVLKEPTLATYRTTIQRLLDKFQKVEIEHMPHSDNKFSDALATLGVRVDIPEEEATIVIKKRTEPSIIPKSKDLPKDWREEILEPTQKQSWKTDYGQACPIHNYSR